MKFIRVSQLDKLGWDEAIHLFQRPALIDAKLQGQIIDDDGTPKRIRLEMFHKREAERRISKIQDDFLADEPVITRKEAVGKIGELRVSIEKADTEIARLQSIAQAAKQSHETVEATRSALEKLGNLNLETLNFQQQAELVAKLGIKLYPSEDLTYMRIYSVLNIAEPRVASCQMTSIASPKL